MKREPVSNENEDKKEEMTEEDDMEQEEKACAKKSEDITEDDLMKSINKLEAFAQENSPEDRKAVLLSKAQETDLEADEQEELISLIKGETADTDESLAEEITKSMEDNETIQKSLDVSDFLSEQHDALTKSLALVADRIEKSDNAQHEFNLMLARTVAQVGKLAKSIDSRLSNYESQPVGKPRSTAKPLNKSFAGQDESAQQQQLSKGEILNTLTGMLEKGINTSELGFDVAIEVAKLEQTGQLSPKAYQAVLKQKQNSTVH